MRSIKHSNENELRQITGGGLSLFGGLGLVGGILFLIGVIDGFVNPEKCND